jgi:hypothetical protein
MNQIRKTKIRYPNIINLIELEHNSDISIEPIGRDIIKITSDGIISLFVDSFYYGTHNKSTICLTDNNTTALNCENGENTVITLQSKSSGDIKKYVYKQQLVRKLIFEYIERVDIGQIIEKCGICIMFRKHTSPIIDCDGCATDEYLVIKGDVNSYIICDNNKFTFDTILTRYMI